MVGLVGGATRAVKPAGASPTIAGASSMIIVGTYDPYLVALSISVACLASYAALDLGHRIRGSRRWARLAWLATAAIVMGGGIWSMHFIGMLAFVMPMKVSYDTDLTLLSLAVAVGAAGFGFLVGTRRVTNLEFMLSGVVVGIGIVAMHYTGMAAMRMAADTRYDPWLVVLSVVIAIGASAVALRLAFTSTLMWQRIVSAVVMGAAISGMHYTGMAAATFIANSAMEPAAGEAALAPTDLALAIAAITFLLQLLALTASAFDRRRAQRDRELEIRNQALRQAHEELVALYEQGILASHLDLEGRIVHANRAAVEDLGFARADIIGKPMWEVDWWYTPEAREWIRNAFERAATGTPFRGELSYELRNGEHRVADLSFVPIKDESGRVTAVFVPGMDTTDRARQYRATFENAGVGIAHLSPDMRWLRVNRTFARIVGHSPDELIGMSVHDITHPDDLEASRAEARRLKREDADGYELEQRYVRKDGTPVWVNITGTAVRGNDGSLDHYVSVIQDVSERRHAEEQNRLLLREMNHRSKNLLSLVQAVARQTAASDPDDFVERFSDRIRAIAANQDLLVRTSWKGVDVDDLVSAQLAHFSDLMGRRINVGGPSLRVNGAAAQAIGMALHELATNASKYGALSTDAGNVDIDWGVDADRFKMNWIERNGPKVTVPKHRGFGTTVMEAIASQAVDGAVEIDYDPKGVAWHLTCPADKALEHHP